MKRRTFVRGAAAGAMALSAGAPLLAKDRFAPPTKLTILHTNDWHSRIEPFPDDGGRNANRGGAARRMALISKVRAAEKHVLLLDSGDIFQGTPYFNFFAGKLEMKLMTRMGYDAATIGNHDFDGGMENLVTQMDHADFPLLNGNYNFNGTPLAGKTQPYKVFEKGGRRIGVFGLGIKLEGLVPKTLYGKTDYQDPVERGNTIAATLRNKERCDLIILLSHLGYRYRDDKISDVALAPLTKNVDVILGGHTHTFLREPVTVANLEGEPVIINQVGFGGLLLGRLDINLRTGGRNSCAGCTNLQV